MDAQRIIYPSRDRKGAGFRCGQRRGNRQVGRGRSLTVTVRKDVPIVNHYTSTDRASVAPCVTSS